MNDARTRILAKLPTAVGLTATTSRSDARPHALRDIDRVRLQQIFVERLTMSEASIEKLTELNEVPCAATAYLKRAELPSEVTLAPGLAELAHGFPSSVSVNTEVERGEVRVALTWAWAGIAETGSIVMLSSEDTPTSLNFLPDVFIVALDVRDLLATMEDVWRRIGTESAKAMPRTINVITGPSRTADVEQIIQLGAHGPRQVHVLLYGD